MHAVAYAQIFPYPGIVAVSENKTGVVGNPSRGNLSRPRQISLGYLSRLVTFARKSVTTLGNLSWPRHISLGYLSRPRHIC